MTMEVDIGKKRFSFTLDDSLTKEELKRMGRSIQYRNQKKLIVTVIITAFIILLLTLYVSQIAIMLYFIVVMEILLYMEFGTRSIVENLRKKFPIEYDFYEDGLIEHVDGKDNLLMYEQFKAIQMTSLVYTMVGKKSEVVVIPRSRLDEESDKLILKLGRILAKKNRNRL